VPLDPCQPNTDPGWECNSLRATGLITYELNTFNMQYEQRWYETSDRLSATAMAGRVLYMNHDASIFMMSDWGRFRFAEYRRQPDNSYAQFGPFVDAFDLDLDDGLSLSISMSDDGLRMVMGAPRAKRADLFPLGRECGALHFFERASLSENWCIDQFQCTVNRVAILFNPDCQDMARMGMQVAMSRDGTLVSTSASENLNPQGNNTGAVITFRRDATSGTWAVDEYYTPSVLSPDSRIWESGFGMDRSGSVVVYGAMGDSEPNLGQTTGTAIALTIKNTKERYYDNYSSSVTGLEREREHGRGLVAMFQCQLDFRDRLSSVAGDIASIIAAKDQRIRELQEANAFLVETLFQAGIEFAEWNP